jgi:hypothetical protein
MSTQFPIPADLQVIAENLQAEGHASRAEVLRNAAARMALLEADVYLLLRTLKMVRRVSTLRVYMDEHGKDYRQLIDETLAEVERLK